MENTVEQIRGAKNFRALAEAIRSAEFSNLDSQEVAAAIRKLAKLEKPATSVRVALLGTHTFPPFPDYLAVRAAASERVLECWVGPYGQYVQPVIATTEALREFAPDIVLLSVELRSIAPRVVNEFGSLTVEEVNAERHRVLEHLLDWAKLASQATAAMVLICNFPRPQYPVFGLADGKRDASESAFYLRLNLELLEALRSIDRINVLDLDATVAAYGGDRAWARRMYYLAKQPWHPGMCAYLARDVWRHVIAAKGWARKCLVVDLDNTLWGGVVGEDGPVNLRVGAGDPTGEAYADFQRAVRGLKFRGVILAVASKNNPEDVDAAFGQHPEMPLRKEDFAIMEVGWHTKVESLQSIAATLGIGLNSLVFLDDNPAERAMVRGALPDVLVPEMPDDPAKYASFLKRQGWFEKPKITAEDVDKTRQYKQQAERAAFRVTVDNLDRYLTDLETEVTVRPARVEDVARVQQLFAKTNQFNVTTRRYGIGEVENFVSSDRYILGLASARDRYGDLGIIGVYLLNLTGENVEVDSFLVSCRALGRGIETALMNALKADVKLARSRGLLVARFIPTQKNAAAAGFFESQGLRAVAESSADEVVFGGSVQAIEFIDIPHIKLT